MVTPAGAYSTPVRARPPRGGLSSVHRVRIWGTLTLSVCRVLGKYKSLPTYDLITITQDLNLMKSGFVDPCGVNLFIAIKRKIM